VPWRVTHVIEARCFGRSEIVTPAGAILPASELLFAFALHLCVRAGEHVPRTDLIEMFWPHSDGVKGRHSLRQMLYRLKEMGFTLDEDGELLSLHPGRVRCDLAEALRAEWITEADADTIAAACDALPGFTRRFSERYGEWIDEVRARLESQFRRAALRVLADAKREGRWYDVEHWALMLLRTDPLNETAVLARAEGTAMLGSKAEAIEQLDRYLNELGPRVERIGLPAKVLRRRIKEQGERRSGQHTLPLVGREEEMRVLTEGLQLSHEGQGGVTLISGVAGIGKSRIATEALELAQLIGFHVVTINPFNKANGQSAPTLATTLASSLKELPGSIGASPAALGVVARITRELAAGSEVPQDIATGSADAQTVAWCLTELLLSISAETPLAILVDNVHVLSAEACAIVIRLTENTSLSRVHWLLVGRDTRDVSPRHTHLRSLPLPHLTIAASQELAGHAARQNPSVFVHRDTNSLAIRGGGNPFFLLALCNGPESLPESATLTRALTERYSSLSEEKRDLLELIHFLGPTASVSRLALLSRLSASELRTHLEELDRYHGFFSESAPGSFRLHDIWTEVLDKQLSQHAASVRALQVATHLDTDAACTTQLDLAWQGELFARAGLPEKAQEKYQLAGDTANARGLSQDALRYFFKALQSDRHNRASLALACRIAAAQVRTFQPQQALSTCDQYLHDHYQPFAADAALRSLLIATRADAALRLNAPFQDDLITLHSLLTVAGANTLTGDMALLVGMRLSLTEASNARSEAFFALASSEACRIRATLPAALARLIFCSEHREPSTVYAIASQIEQAVMLCPHPDWTVTALRYVSMAYRWLGETVRSDALAIRGTSIAQQLGYLDEVLSFSIQCCNMHLDWTNVTMAEPWIDRAKAIPEYTLSPERSRALLFTKARLLVHAGLFDQALELYAERGITPSLDSLKRRATLDSAIIGLANLGVRQEEAATREATFIIETVADLAPSQQLDFAVEAAGTIAVTRSHDHLIRGLHAYSVRRSAAFRRFIPPGFPILNKLSQNLA